MNAYSGELKDETLDGQRVVIGGVVTGVRTIITKARSTMAVATLEDLQGSVEVVIFPKLHEQTGPTWQEGAILLVGGRIDHRGEEVSLLADLVRDFEVAEAGGEEAFAAEFAAADRGRPRGRPGANGNGVANANAGGAGRHLPPGASLATGPAASSPLRGGAPASPSGSPAASAGSPPGSQPGRPSGVPEPVTGTVEPADLEALAPDREEPALPDEARAAARGAAAAPTAPREAGPDGRLHVRFAAGIPADDLQAAMAEVRDVLRAAPAPRASRSISRRDLDGRPSRWSCGPASPTTRSWPRRSAAGCGPGSSSWRWRRIRRSLA